MSNIGNKVVLITAASSGIGRATAKAFATRGARVSLAARRENELGTLLTEIETLSGTATFLCTDVSVAKDVEPLVAHTIKTFGRLDFAVNNVGIEGVVASITDYPEEMWDRALDINMKGAFLCIKYEAKAMLEAGHGGAIVNVGSINS
jgi:NAD(P)-dependent dehydrogenase (short-subunit alcohol dehydrogenase family)